MYSRLLVWCIHPIHIISIPTPRRALTKPPEDALKLTRERPSEPRLMATETGSRFATTIKRPPAESEAEEDATELGKENIFED
jgi:hypothetical protein